MAQAAPQITNDTANIYYTIPYSGTPTKVRVYIDTDRNATTGYAAFGIGSSHFIENGSLYRHSGTGNSWGWTFVKRVSATTSNGVAKITVAQADLGSPSAIDSITQTDPPTKTSAKLTYTIADNTAAISAPQVTNDAANVYYKIPYSSTPKWVRIYIDTDRNATTGYAGFGIGSSYLIENGNLFRHSGAGTGWGWTFVKKVASTTSNGVANVTVARADLGSPSAIDSITQTDPPTKTSAKLSYTLIIDVSASTTTAAATTTTAAATTTTAAATTTTAAATTTTRAATTTTAAATTTTRAATTTTAAATTTTRSVTTTTALPASGSIVTSVNIQNTGSAGQSSVPVSFGQVFGAGHVTATESVTGKLADGSAVPLQVDVKARHADGSLRHAIISAVLPQLAANQTQTIGLAKIAAPSAPAATSPTTLTNAGFTASVTATIGGVAYSASADTLLKSGAVTTWLSGPLVNEWLVSAPLKTAGGAEHPHLTARFAIRSYTGLNKARVDVTIENGWAYEPNPQNFTYDARVVVGGVPVYTKTGLTHYSHTRWHKSFWWGTGPQTHVRHNTAYLIASKAVPNYDQTVVVPEADLAALQANWTGAKTEPMGAGLAVAYMPTTGGRPDIGLIPGWAVKYLLSMDKRAKDVTLGTADMAGSWSAHYRDKVKGYAVSPVDYPYVSILGRQSDTLNPATGKYEVVAACTGDATACAKNANTIQSAHQPSLTYLPYLVTGDHYYLEELQFYAMWNVAQWTPAYRGFEKGLIKPDEIRGQAWILRSLAEAAYITPDNDPLKSHFAAFVSNNLDWYNQAYTNNAHPDNTLGAITEAKAMVYAGGVGLAPWQDDFFTSAVGHAAELGFTKAKPLLAWKAKFPVTRMTGNGTCWIAASIYRMNLRDTVSSPIYTTIGQAYLASNPATLTSLACASAQMAAQLGLQVGEMMGASKTPDGAASIIQPALAYSVDSAIPNAGNAWQIYQGRAAKPNYGTNPQFAIVPR